jgi:hypothetical protein|tara:strand:- start:960 stop:1118 length:159 start_codon:yes stop_codon:yes gene_type:complete
MFASRIVSYAFMAMGTASSGALDGWSAVGTNALFETSVNESNARCDRVVVAV